jgi:hypothetical protein
MSTKTYDPALYTIAIAAIPINKGYADGEFITVERETDAFTDVAGTDGDVARAKQHDKRATCTLTLMQTAEANALLSTLALLDENADNGAGVGPFLLKDRGGLTVHTAAECWVMRMPDVTLDKGVTARQWKIRIASLNSFEGGN